MDMFQFSNNFGSINSKRNLGSQTSRKTTARATENLFLEAVARTVMQRLYSK